MNWTNLLDWKNLLAMLLASAITGSVGMYFKIKNQNVKLREEITSLESKFFQISNNPDNNSINTSNLVDFINFSSLPIYIADQKMKVLGCNDAYLNFFSTSRDKVINRHIVDLSRESIKWISKENSENYKTTQKELEKQAASGKLPIADAYYIFDMTKHPNQNFRNYYDVHIHLDSKISKKNDLGYMTIFFVKERK